METKQIITKSGKEYNFTRTKNDVNGNPVYLVSWLALGLTRYESTVITRRAGLRKRGACKGFGGGFAFQSYNLKESAEFFESLGLHR